MPTKTPSRPLPRALAIAAAGLCLASPPASAALFEDATEATIGDTGEWSNKVLFADVTGDGWPDLVLANGGNYASAGTPQANRVFANPGDLGGAWQEVTDDVFGPDAVDLARAIKVEDLTGDGVADIFVATTYQTQSRLFVGLGGGAYQEETEALLPEQVGSFGDVEAGDVDGDGDLDLVLADWGPGNPLSNSGGRTKLWLNGGDGVFFDATEFRMPDIDVRFSWELELADVDNDWDLDLLISCKSCAGSYLFRNDGFGKFTDDSGALPQFSNNYDFEAADLDGDGWLDLVTINDGPGLTEHLFLNDQTGSFFDATDDLWAEEANVGDDDNMIAVFDADADGDLDFLIGSLSGQDRLLVNDLGGATGQLQLVSPATSGAGTPGTLGVAVADVDGDGKLDLAQAQGEVASPDKLMLGVDVAADTLKPAFTRFRQVPFVADDGLAQLTVEARLHDHKLPVASFDFLSVEVRYTVDSGDGPSVEQVEPMAWFGEALFRAELSELSAPATVAWRACAVDRLGLESCLPEQAATLEGGSGPDPADPGPEPTPDAPPEMAPDAGVAQDVDASSEDAVSPGDGHGLDGTDSVGPEPDLPSDTSAGDAPEGGSGADDARTTDAPDDRSGAAPPQPSVEDAGCATGGGGAPKGALWLLVGATWLGWARRQRQRRAAAA